MIQHDTASAYVALQGLALLLIAVAIGWRILKRSRIAASTGLLLSLTLFAVNWITQGFVSKNSLPLLIMMFMLFHSVRAVFARSSAVDIGENQKP